MAYQWASYIIGGIAFGFIAASAIIISEPPSLRDGIHPSDRGALELLIQSSDCEPRGIETRCIDI